MRVLLVEDNKDIAASIAEYLESHGYICDFAYSGLAGLHHAQQAEYDAYIFDIALPGMDGLKLCETLRQDKKDTTPIIFLTARDTLEDKLVGFDVGADDYLVKPFELQELHVRLRAITRRSSGSDVILRIGDLYINTETHEVKRGETPIHLSPNIYKLLIVLASRSPAVVSRTELEYLMWGDDLPDSDSLRSHIYKLRKYVDKPFGLPLVHTVQGTGFRMAAL